VQSEEILSNPTIKCSNSSFNAQASGVTIVIVKVGAVKIYVAAVEALREKERQDETQFYHQSWWKISLGPRYLGL
jgi:hypothetical protein